jgi:hypothetical protein
VSRAGSRALAAAVLGLGVGVAAGVWLRGGAPEPIPTAPVAASPDARLGARPEPDAVGAGALRALRAELLEERRARVDLADRVAQLERDLTAPDEDVAPVDARVESTAEAAYRAPGAARWFDEYALLDRGLAPGEVTGLRERFEENEMAELYLRDQAAREGWLRSPRYRRELEQLRASYRDEVGDAAFDLALWAAGRNNRAIVANVLRTSPAARAGLRAGDAVLRYDGRAVFSPRGLALATRTSRSGSSVPIDVRRGDDELRFYLESGPLGVRLKPGRTPPEAR